MNIVETLFNEAHKDSLKMSSVIAGRLSDLKASYVESVAQKAWKIPESVLKRRWLLGLYAKWNRLEIEYKTDINTFADEILFFRKGKLVASIKERKLIDINFYD